MEEKFFDFLRDKGCINDWKYNCQKSEEHLRIWMESTDFKSFIIGAFRWGQGQRESDYWHNLHKEWLKLNNVPV